MQVFDHGCGREDHAVVDVKVINQLERKFLELLRVRSGALRCGVLCVFLAYCDTN
jgi:hypothetical protein